MKKNKILILFVAIIGLFAIKIEAMALDKNEYKVQRLAITSVLPGNETINAWRFAQKGAGVGRELACGRSLFITSCYVENDVSYCYYENRNISDTPGISYGANHNEAGVVYREKLTVDLSAAELSCDEEEEEAEYGYRYASTSGIRDTDFPCGAKLYITSCHGEICNFSRIQDRDYNVTYVDGTVTRKYLSYSYIDETCPEDEDEQPTEDEEDEEEEEEIPDCVNSPQFNVKGTFTYNVCYNKGFEDDDVKELIETNNLIVCGNNYVLDSTATRASGSENCNSEYCSRDYTVNCSIANVQGSINLSAEPAVVNNSGKGIVTVSATSNNGEINGYYVSDYYEAPTSISEWTSVNSGDFTIEMSPGVKYLWVKDSNGTISSVMTIAVIDKVNVNTTIKTLTLKDASNNDISISGGVSYKSDADKIETDNYVKLANRLDDNKIADGFNPFNSEYKMTVSSPTITVYATLTSNDAEYVEGFGPRTVNLNYGVNTVLIKIRDKEGKERTYTLLITRKDDRSADNTLSDIKLSVGDLVFNSNVTEYKVEIPQNTTNVNVSATISSELSSYLEGYEPGNVEITGNTTSKLIKVKSQTGSTRTYVITFIKKGSDVIEKESLQLSGLTIPGVNIPFESKIANYNLTVGYTTDVINLYTPLKTKGSTVTIKIKRKNDSDYVVTSNLGIGLDVGENYIEIEVKDKDGDTAYYRLTIVRKEFGLNVEDKTSLKELNVSGYNIKFEPNKKEYTVKIKTEKTLVISAVPTSNRAEVFIRGNEDLTGFSTVRIKVVAENGDYDTYSIDIKKDAYNKQIELASIIAGVVIILFSSCIILIKKKYKAKKDYIRE